MVITYILPAQKNAINPTYENVSYGNYDRNVLDFWQTDSNNPTPLVVYIHGGGFTGGSKNGIRKNKTLLNLLDQGISVAAINYRLINTHPLPVAHLDAIQAIQFLRYKSKEWLIDKNRIGAFGGSAGAQLCIYLAFHDDFADPQEARGWKYIMSCLVSN
jgi:acetyl esterase/lipase